MFIIVNKKTKRPLRLTYMMETKGQTYNNYEVTVFSLEDEEMTNQESPIFMTQDRSKADLIVNHQGNEKIDTPKIEPHYIDGEKSEYEVKELVLK